MRSPHLAGVGDFTTGTALALTAAVLFAVGSVLQHQALSGGSNRGVELRALVRRPVWLAGQATTASGSLLQVAAPALAPVSIVQPLLAGALVIALGIRAVRSRCLPGAGEVLGAICTVGGLTVFLAAARHEHAVVRWARWSAGCAAVSRRAARPRSSRRRSNRRDAQATGASGCSWSRLPPWP
ncbi:hypothetical protein [Amycolatopsis acididurans]|uniref:hypothetical protein n=1 Tax=Amycolatopsis acididurans TaxID=2724524 RepID=UPI001FEC9E46|nr:hypothetical protein [Amycolatopsis acididurans]